MEIRPSPDPDTYPEEPDGVDEARRPSRRGFQIRFRYRLVGAIIFFLFAIGITLGMIASSLGDENPLYGFITIGSILAFLFSGVLFIVLLCDAASGGLFTEMYARPRRRGARSRRSRLIRRRRVRSDLEEPAPSHVLSQDQYDSLPAWLLPLLKNRPASLSLHDEITAIATTTEETETLLQTAFDDLPSEVTTIPYTPDETEVSPSTSAGEKEALEQPYQVEYPAEAIVEREAVLDLLGALELQYKDGRVTENFYKRKRKQLLDRLASVS